MPTCSQITISDLAELTGKSKSHISHLVRRGILPAPVKEGRFKYLPRVECILIMGAHVEDTLWKPRPSRKKKDTDQTVLPKLSDLF